MNWLARVVSSRVRELEEQLRVEGRAAEENMHRWAEALGRATRAEARIGELEKQVVELNAEAASRFAEVRKLRGERDVLAKDLDASRDVAIGLRADLAEVRRSHPGPAVGVLATAPPPDPDEVTRLAGDLARTKRALAAAWDRLAEYREGAGHA